MIWLHSDYIPTTFRPHSDYFWQKKKQKKAKGRGGKRRVVITNFWSIVRHRITLGGSHKNVVSAIILALNLQLWNGTTAFTLKRSPTTVVSVTFHAKPQGTFGGTWWKNTMTLNLVNMICHSFLLKLDLYKYVMVSKDTSFLKFRWKSMQVWSLQLFQE